MPIGPSMRDTSRPGAPRKPEHRWRSGAPSTPAAVTSQRLGATAPVQNPLLPKVRSWLALGAPLELLSPLSLMRALVGLALVTVCAEALVPAWRGTDERSKWACAIALVVLAAALVPPKRLGRRASALSTIVLATIIAVLVAATRATVAIVVPLSLVPLVALFGALFLGPSEVLLGAAAILLGVVGALLGHVQSTAGLAVALFELAATAGTYALGRVLARSAAERGQIDRDTGVPNGYGLAARIASGGSGAPVAVASVALGGIAEVREAFGFEVGTELLCRVVEDLGQIVPRGTQIGRVEGDELVVTWRPKDQGADARELERSAVEIARALSTGIEHGCYRIGDVAVQLQAHIGLTVEVDDQRPFAELVRQSALAARSAARRREPVRVFTPTAGTLTPADLSLVDDLRRAIDKPGELRLAFQAQVDARSHEPLAAEVLARWEHPRLGSVSPGRFIPLAERSGVIAALTRRLFEDALGALERLERREDPIGLSVNLSPVLLGQRELADWLLAELAARDVDPARLTIEVTESSPIDLGEALALLEPLHDLGTRISIDDFGTGYTSIANLPSLPVDELKVDQRFVLASLTSPPDEAIVASLVELGRRLSLTLVAEGVETESHALSMERLGFDLLQGFHFARPEPEDALVARLEHSGRTNARRHPSHAG